MHFQYYKVAIAVHIEREGEAALLFLDTMGCPASVNGFGTRATDGSREWCVLHGFLNPAQYEKLPEFISSFDICPWGITDARDETKWNEIIKFEDWLLQNDLQLIIDDFSEGIDDVQ